MTSSIQIKRHRDPLLPKPILDRQTLTKSLLANTSTRTLKNAERQIDLFYQLLHRSGYNVPLDVFVTTLLRDDGILSVTDTTNSQNTGVKLPAKNAVSTRPGRLPQLSRAFLQFLSDECNGSDNGFVMLTSRMKMHQTSTDGTTTKIAVELQDGHLVESVLMRHEGRTTLCVSSQVGLVIVY
jgi:hypothetical protein